MSAVAVSAQLETESQDIRDFHARMKEEVGRVLVGMDATVSTTVQALLANGHVLLEGVPGVAKTSLSKVLSVLLGLDSQRLQFTPDLLPQDVTGTTVPDRKSGEWVLRKGPVFTNILLADEINRASAKTQSSLLEAMQEKQVSIEGQTLPLSMPFLVMATQNPIEQEGVYRLPEAQLDRFLVCIKMAYPDRRREIEMLSRRSESSVDLKPIANGRMILAWQELVDRVHAEKSVVEYIVDLVRATRKHPAAFLGGSPRAALALLKMSRSRAICEGRTYITHEDVQAVAPGVLSHRIIVRPESELEGWTGESIVRDALGSEPVIAG